jgi:hypothetical protein
MLTTAQARHCPAAQMEFYASSVLASLRQF